jgi:DNA (cytosine-5)-methyltransferase 1
MRGASPSVGTTHADADAPSPPEHTVIDLFAGCGGMTQGFVEAGYVPVFAVEEQNVAAADVPRADVVIGGPPCQGFSALGLQDANDPRNKLWTEYVRIVLAAEPDAFVIENVDRYLTSGEFERLRYEVDQGALSDYELVAGVLNAADFGVPQRRKRTIIIGAKRGSPALPEPTHSPDARLDREVWITLSEALEDVPLAALPADSLPADEFVEIAGTRVPGPFSMDELHFGRNPTQLSLDRYAAIRPGGGRLDLAKARPDLLPNCWRDRPTGSVDVMGRLEWNRPSVTIRTEFFKPEKGRYLHPQWDATDPGKRVDRPITHLEAALIQTFPRHFIWCGSKTEIARQIGNAVPPRLARAIAERIRPLLSQTAGSRSERGLADRSDRQVGR